MKIFKIIVFSLMANATMAQNLTTAKIEKIEKSGLHSIVLPTLIRSVSRENLSDFRILDSKKNEVPYYINDDNIDKYFTTFNTFKIISKTAIPNKNTTIILENPKLEINEIVLSIANADVTKNYSVSGSNDQVEWFGLVNNQELYADLDSEKTNGLTTIPVPLTSYKFLKIVFDDKKTLPINVLKSGDISSKTTRGDLLEIFTKSNTNAENKIDKKTTLHVIFSNLEIINQISFNIAAPKLYKRYVRVYKLVSVKVKHKFEIQQRDLTTFELNAASKNTFDISQITEKDIYLEIENQDNPPLTINKIQFFQTPISVVADLKADENYTISTENENAIAPNYDLESFKSAIKDDLPKAKIIDIVLPQFDSAKFQEKAFYEQPWFMWICICLGGAAVLFFSVNLLKDLNKPNS